MYNIYIHIIIITIIIIRDPNNSISIIKAPILLSGLGYRRWPTTGAEPA